MCGMSCASYATVTGASRLGIVAPVSVAGIAASLTLAVRPSAVDAVSVAIVVPGGGTYTTCRPVVVEIVPPPLNVQLTSAVLLRSTASSCVGPVTLTVPDGLMESSGPGFGAWSQAAAARTHTTTIVERIGPSRTRWMYRESRVFTHGRAHEIGGAAHVVRSTCARCVLTSAPVSR